MALPFPIYKTGLGAAHVGDSLQLLAEMDRQSVQLVMTSPPFALQRQKEYGNRPQDEYVEWLLQFSRAVAPVLLPHGSFVIDIGGAYVRGKPVRSLHNFKFLLKMCEEEGWFLAEEFFWNNPSKLPSPIEWVNKRKIRAKDSVNTVWWFSRSEDPKADVSKVLSPYSDRMKKLLSDPQAYYTPKKRPSGHDISDKFHDNGGAIPSNLLNLPNTESNSRYLQRCKAAGLEGHPARFPAKLPEFFISFLTDPGDLVLDIFAGSNTTGAVAERLGRRWLAFEQDRGYLATSAFRFMEADDAVELRELHGSLMQTQSTMLLGSPAQTRLHV